MLTRGVVTPGGVEVAVVDQGAEFGDGFGAVQSPAGTGDVESVADRYLNCWRIKGRSAV
jgi:predicted RecB family endonuclease